MKKLIITILFTHVFAQNNSDADYKMNSIIDGMYEIVSWWDEKIFVRRTWKRITPLKEEILND